jgi:hypothetical protein
MNLQQRQASACASGARVTSNPYFSKVRITATRSGAGPYVHTVSAGALVRAFGYGQGQDMGPGGRTGTNATKADTNILSPGQTISGQSVNVEAMAIAALSNSNPKLLQQLMPELVVELSMNGGETQLNLGNPILWPCSGGLFGSGQDDANTQQLGGVSNPVAFFSNGLPGHDNAGRFPEGLVWTPDGGVDSNLNINLTCTRAVAITEPATQSADNDVASVATGVPAFTEAADGAVFCDFLVVLYGPVVSIRSQVL